MSYNQLGPTTSNTTDLASLVSALGSNPSVIWITISQTIAAPLTVPANISLKFIQGATLIPASGITCTILGYVDAGPFKIFDLSQGGTISFGYTLGQSFPTGNTTFNTYYMEWWSPRADGGDASAVINAAIAAVPDFCFLDVVSAPRWVITEPILMQSRTSLKIRALPLSDQTPRVQIVYAGSASDFNVNMLSCQYCEFSGFFIESGFSLGGINIDGSSSVLTISSQNLISYNYINNNRQQSPWYGIAIALSTLYGNNEFMRLEHNFVYGNGTTAALGIGQGLYCGGTSNAHGHTLIKNSFFHLAIGIGGIWTGYYSFQSNFNSNTIDIEIGHMAYPTIFEYSDSEVSQQHMVFTTGGESTVALRSARLAGLGGPGLGWFELRGVQLTVEDVNFDNYGGISIGSYLFDCTNLSNGTPILLKQNIYAVVSEGMPQADVLFGLNNGSSSQDITIISDTALGNATRSGMWTNNQVGDRTLSGCLIGTATESVSQGVTPIVSNTLTITVGIMHVSTSGGLIKNFAFNSDFLPGLTWTGEFTLIAVGASGFTTDATGNISKAITVTQGQLVKFVYDGTKFYPISAPY